VKILSKDLPNQLSQWCENATGWKASA